jgi:hypothetical protein
MPEQRGMRAILGTILIRVLIPIYVLAGAVSKLTSAGVGDLPSWIIDPAVTSDALAQALPYILKLIIFVELAAAGLMFFVRRLARPAAIFILGAFCFVLIAEISHGGDSCGCFGRSFTIDPKVMLAIDAGLLLAAVFLTTTPATAGDPDARRAGTSRPAMAAAGVWLAASLVLALAGPFARPPQGNPQFDPYLWRPQQWIGMRFEETPLVEIGIDPSMYGGGEQVWVFYRRTCGTCHALFEDRFCEDPLEQTVIAIHVPPGRDEPQEDGDEVCCPECEFYELDRSREWPVISTPLVLHIGADGVITRAEDVKLEGAAPHVGDSGH